MLGAPEVARWLRPASGGRPGSEPYSTRETGEEATRNAAHWTAHQCGRWRLTEEDQTVAVGGLSFVVIRGRAELEASWAVRPERWGQGLAGMIGRRSLDWAAKRGARSLVAFTRAENLASVRVMEKLGMTFEADFEHAGLAHVLYRVATSG